MNELQTITGIDLPIETRGVVYLCILLEDKLLVSHTLIFNDAYAALNAYANIPNPESQIAMGEDFNDLVRNLNKLHKDMKDPKWVKKLHEYI